MRPLRIEAKLKISTRVLLAGSPVSVTPIGSGFPYDALNLANVPQKPGSAYNLDELQKGWGLYLQDSYRITPHLTANFGLRWDFIGDDHDLTSAYHGATLADIYGPSGIGNIFEPGTLTGDMNPAYVATSHQYAPWNVTPQPTIGLAWNPNYSEGILSKLFGGSSTVIRAGFDIKRFHQNRINISGITLRTTAWHSSNSFPCNRPMVEGRARLHPVASPSEIPSTHRNMHTLASRLCRKHSAVYLHLELRLGRCWF